MIPQTHNVWLSVRSFLHLPVCLSVTDDTILYQNNKTHRYEISTGPLRHTEKDGRMSKMKMSKEVSKLDVDL